MNCIAVCVHNKFALSIEIWQFKKLCRIPKKNSLIQVKMPFTLLSCWIQPPDLNSGITSNFYFLIRHLKGKYLTLSGKLGCRKYGPVLCCTLVVLKLFF